MSSHKFKPSLSKDAAKGLQNPLVPLRDSFDQIAMGIVSSAIMAFKINSTALLWIGWFLLLSLFINRNGKQSGIPVIGIALILMTCSIIFYYLRIDTTKTK